MNFELLEDIRLFIGQEVRKLRISAQNSRSNGYLQIALNLENEASFGDRILRELAQEKTNAK